jgi:hypothetical protein
LAASPGVIMVADVRHESLECSAFHSVVRMFSVRFLFGPCILMPLWWNVVPLTVINSAQPCGAHASLGGLGHAACSLSAFMLILVLVLPFCGFYGFTVCARLRLVVDKTTHPGSASVVMSKTKS